MSKEELSQINGGSVLIANLGKWAILGAASSFLIGLISGAVRPYPCSSTK